MMMMMKLRLYFYFCVFGEFFWGYFSYCYSFIRPPTKSDLMQGHFYWGGGTTLESRLIHGRHEKHFSISFLSYLRHHVINLAQQAGCAQEDDSLGPGGRHYYTHPASIPCNYITYSYQIQIICAQL